MKSLLGCKYPVVTVFNTDENNQYESIGLKVGMDLFEDFIYLHDTVLIKDQSLFDKLFEYKGMVSICPRFLSYLGKYESKILKEHPFEEVRTKRQACAMEMWLGRVFAGAPCFDNTLVDGNHRFEQIYGSKRMVLENSYLKKMKGTWSTDMIRD